MEVPPAIEERQPAKRAVQMPGAVSVKKSRAENVTSTSDSERETRKKELSQLITKTVEAIKNETLKRSKNPDRLDVGAYQYLQQELQKLASTPNLQKLVYAKLTQDPELKKLEQKGVFIFGDKTIFDTTLTKRDRPS